MDDELDAINRFEKDKNVKKKKIKIYRRKIN